MSLFSRMLFFCWLTIHLMLCKKLLPNIAVIFITRLLGLPAAMEKRL